MTDIDILLARMGRSAIPDALFMIDDAVFSAMAKRQRDAALAPRLMGIAATFALFFGIVGGSFSGTSSAAAQSLSPLTSANALAPSTLLDIRP